MLKERLLADLKDCMKEKKEIRKNVIQMIRAAILQVEKDKQIKLTDEQIIEIMAKEAKKRRDSIADYEKGGREDIVKQIKEEIAVIEEYLPKQLTEDELEEIIKEIIKSTGATTMKDMGMVMKAAKEEIGSRADGRRINEVVKKQLQ